MEPIRADILLRVAGFILMLVGAILMTSTVMMGWAAEVFLHGFYLAAFGVLWWIFGRYA